MTFRSSIRIPMSRLLFGLLVVLILTTPAHSVDSQDSQIFISGFNAYQKKNYQAAVDNMSEVLRKYPDSPLRDMAIFWLARSNYKAGNQQDAGRYMSQFLKEYPDSPLKGTVEEELIALARQHEKGEQPQTTAAKTVAGQGAAEKTKVAAVDQEKAKVAAEKAEAERMAAARAEQERQAKEKAAAEQKAAEQAKVAKEQEDSARAAAEKAALAKAEQEKVAREKAKADRLAAEQAEQERIAREKSAAEQRVAEEARNAKEREAAARAEEEKKAREQAAAAEGEAPKASAAKAEPKTETVVAQALPAKSGAKKSASSRKKEESRKSGKGSKLRDKAIAEYKTVIDRFPGTSAAASAQAKLREMGIVYPTAATSAEANVQVLNLEIGQFAAVDFTVSSPASASEVGKRFTIPFDVTNRGNGDDSFYLEAGFPSEFDPQLAAADSPTVLINMTPTLPPGGVFKGVLAVTIPRGNIDGRKNSYPLKVASRFAREVSQSRQISLVSSAPLLRAVMKSDRNQILPGERVSYKVVLLNIGSAPARGVSFQLNYPPQYEPVAPLPAGFRQEMQASLVMDGVQLNSGQSWEYTLTFRLKGEAVARQELLLRGDMVNAELETRDSFISTAAYVQGVSKIQVRTPVERLQVIPGQAVAIPLIVTNNGNVREPVVLKAQFPNTLGVTFYQDLNRDGIRQSDEPAITTAGPLAPKEEAYLLMEVTTPATASDGSEAQLNVLLEPENAPGKGVTASLKLAFSRPMVDLAMVSQGGRLKPGEVASFDLTCTNRGSSMAKVVELQSQLPVNLDMVAADPPFKQGSNGSYLWRFGELGAGEKKNVKVTFRIKEGIAVGTTIQVRNLISYEDQLGNRY